MKKTRRIHTGLAVVLGILMNVVIASERPNIIFILVDDLGWGDVEFNGQSKIKTPALTQMAEEGAVLTDFYAGAPVCGPSRATLLYGQHTGRAPIRGNPRWTVSGQRPVMSADSQVFPKALKKAGYTTAVFGKWAMNEVITNPETGDGEGHPFRQGFDEFVGFNTHLEAHYHWPDYVWDGHEKVMLGEEKGENWRKKLCYADDLFTEKTLDFIERKAGEPFFVYLNYTAPHKGYSAPEEHRKPYEELGWPHRRGRVAHYRDDKDVFTAYAGMISSFDEGIGQIRAKLAEKGIAENTLIIFTNDNGDEISSDFFESEGALRGGKRMLTEGGIRMPTVAVWPKVIQPGSKVSHALAFWDVMPTLCEIVGAEPHAECDGISFLPALKGEGDAQKEHEYLYWEFNEKAGPMQALRFGKYKVIRHWNKPKEAMGKIKLYDLSVDLKEKNDIAEQNPEVVAQAVQYFAAARTHHPEWELSPRQPAPPRK